MEEIWFQNLLAEDSSIFTEILPLLDSDFIKGVLLSFNEVHSRIVLDGTFPGSFPDSRTFPNSEWYDQFYYDQIRPFGLWGPEREAALLDGDYFTTFRDINKKHQLVYDYVSFCKLKIYQPGCWYMLPNYSHYLLDALDNMTRGLYEFNPNSNPQLECLDEESRDKLVAIINHIVEHKVQITILIPKQDYLLDGSLTNDLSNSVDRNILDNHTISELKTKIPSNNFSRIFIYVPEMNQPDIDSPQFTFESQTNEPDINSPRRIGITDFNHASLREKFKTYNMPDRSMLGRIPKPDNCYWMENESYNIDKLFENKK